MQKIKVKKLISLLIGCNLLLFLSLAFFLLKAEGKGLYTTLETRELIVRAPKSQSSIIIRGDEKAPTIAFLDEKGTARITFEGGNEPKVAFYTKNNEPLGKIYSIEDEALILSLNDNKGRDRLVFQGGEIPGVFIRNHQNKTVGSWSLLSDGGAGLGMAYGNGLASSVLRGGTNPTLAFFAEGKEPSATLGLIQSVPHLLIATERGNEAILIHGGDPSGMMVADERGNLKVFINKDGIFQGREESPVSDKKKPEKFFSWESDMKTLFPDVPNVENKSNR